MSGAVVSSVQGAPASAGGRAVGHGEYVYSLPELVGSSVAMARLRRLIDAVAPKDSTVLINGPSGTGKELVARHIHARSRRCDGAFVAVDCTGLRDTLLESQLFGHVKGAFTGAEQAAVGFIRSADGGTLFLDEIGEMDVKTQAKLLRVIQERCVVPLGAVRPVPVNVRVVAATHRDLKAMVARGEFREDLYYRLDVVRLEVPSLAARREDVPELVEHFLARVADLFEEPRRTVPPDVMALLSGYTWPGNVRELAHAIEHMVVFSAAADGTLSAESVPERVRSCTPATRDGSQTSVRSAFDPDGPVAVDGASSGGAGGVGLMTLEAAERTLIARTLQATGGNQSRAAAILNIERRRLYRKVKRYGLSHLARGGEQD